MDQPGGSSRDSRRPRWVYARGEEPDYRFSYANERTLLAWIRTALALLAGAVAVDSVSLPLPEHTRSLLAVALILLGLVCAGSAWWRWARNERAMRLGQPLPSLPVGLVVAGGVVLVGVILLIGR